MADVTHDQLCDGSGVLRGKMDATGATSLLCPGCYRCGAPPETRRTSVVRPSTAADERATCTWKDCAAVATSRYFWPGKEPLAVCASHRVSAHGIADAMGFPLHSEDLP